MVIKDIARLANVSVSTVSKIINNKAEDINPKTVERVLAIVKENNYVPYAKVMKNKNKQFSIALVNSTVPESGPYLDGVITTAENLCYHVSVFYSSNDLEKERRNLDYISTHDFDGMIWSPIDDTNLNVLDEMKNAGLSYEINSTSKLIKGNHLDYRYIFNLMTQKLIENGHDRICLIEHDDNDRKTLSAEYGFQNALIANDIHFTSDLIMDIDNPSILNKLINNGITALVCVDEKISQVIEAKLSSIGKTIPEDLSLITAVNSTPGLENLSRYSAYTVPKFEYGSYICKKLITSLESGNREVVETFQTQTDYINKHTIRNLTKTSEKLVVIGSINIDILMGAETLPVPGCTNMCSSVSTLVGGKAANQALGTRKLEGNVALIGKVGSDFYANYVYSLMQENHISLTGISEAKDSDTGKAFIWFTKEGENMISILPGANFLLNEDDILKREKDFIGASYCLVQSEIPMDLVKFTLRLAKKHDVKTIFKPAMAQSVDKETLSLCDIFIPNRKEAIQLCPQYGGDIKAMAKYFHKLGADTVIITLSSKGSYVYTENDDYHIDVVDVLDVLDTTGGSDAYISALATYLSRGYTLKKAARIASYAANICISRLGVTPGLADKLTLETLINKHEPDLLKYKN